MPCKVFTLLLLLGTALPLSVASAADERDDSRYFAFEINYADLDEKRDTESEGLGGSFLYGFRIAGNWALEARLTGLVLERGDAGGTDFYQQDIGVDAVYRFGNGDWRPFALLGLSAIRNDVEDSELDDIGAGAHAGVGLITVPLGHSGMRLRVEARYVHDEFLDGMQDVRIGLGLQIPLGAKSVAASVTRDGPAEPAMDDSDNDGVRDSDDRCLDSLPYVEHDTAGCMQPDQTIRMYEVAFNNGTAILTTAAREELHPLVMALRHQPDLHIRIDGHTDASGSAESNRKLSLERAEAVATHLALQGVPTQRITVRGFGESRPVDSNATAAGRERNRRIEIVLLAPPGH